VLGCIGAELVQDKSDNPAVSGRETKRLAFHSHRTRAMVLEWLQRSLDEPLELKFLRMVLKDKVFGPRQRLQPSHEGVAVGDGGRMLGSSLPGDGLNEREHVLHPVLELLDQHLLPTHRFLKRPMRSVALDGGCEQVGIVSQERDVVVIEIAVPRGVDLEHAKRPILAGDENVDHALDVVLDEDIGYAEPRFTGEIPGDHRLVMEEGVACGRVTIGTEPDVAHYAGIPVHAGANEELLAPRHELEDLGAPHANPVGHELRRAVQKLVQVVGPEGVEAELGQFRSLMAQPLGRRVLVVLHSAHSNSWRRPSRL
jgi:hypothetical protein